MGHTIKRLGRGGVSVMGCLALLALCGAPTCEGDSTTVDEPLDVDTILENTDPEGDWPTTCSNGDFTGMAGPAAMDITSAAAQELLWDPEVDPTAVGIGVGIYFAGDTKAFLEAEKASKNVKPNIVVQILLVDGTYIEARLEDDCTFKVSDAVRDVKILALDMGAIILAFDRIRIDDVLSIEVQSFDYDALGLTYCDTVTVDGL